MVGLYKGHTEKIKSIEALNDGQTYLSCSKDGSIIAYDILHKEYVKRFWPGSEQGGSAIDNRMTLGRKI